MAELVPAVRVEPQRAVGTCAAHALRADLPAARRSLGQRLLERLLRSDDLRPRWTAGRIGAAAIAVAVHALTLGLLAGGVALIVVDNGNPVAIVLGVLMVVCAWFMRPRVGRAPKAGIVSRERAPRLH